MTSALMTLTELTARVPDGPWPLWLALLAPLAAAVTTGVGAQTREGVTRRASFTVAVLGTVLALVGVVAAWANGAVLDKAWAPSLGIRLHLGLDALSAPTAVAAVVAVLVATLLSGRDNHDPRDGDETRTHTLTLLMLVAVLATLAARDAVLLLIALSGVVLPVWAMAFRRPGRFAARRAVATRFAGTFGTGIGLMLAGVLVLARAAGGSDLALLGLATPGRAGLLAAVLVTVGGALVLPLWPVHAWWPPLASELPGGSAVALGGAVLPLGGYVLVRLLAGAVPERLHTVGLWLAALAAVTMLWCALVALGEADVARLLGVLALGATALPVVALGAATRGGVEAAAFALPVASLQATALLGSMVCLRRAWGSTRLDRVREALRDALPRLGIILLGTAALAVALPGTVSFWAVLRTVTALTDPVRGALTWSDRLVLVLLALALLVTLGAVLRLLRTVWSAGWTVGADPTRTVELPKAARDIQGVARWVMLALVLLAVVLGLVPAPLSDVAARAAEHLGVR